MCMITLYTPKIIIKSIMRVNILLDISLSTRLKHKAKYIITACIPLIVIKYFYFFSLMHIRMSGKNISFDDKKIFKKLTFTKKKKYFR